MNPSNADASLQTRPNGAGAAAVLSAGIGVLVLGVLTIAGDKSSAVKSAMIFYKPTGPLSGVTSVAVLAWLLFWLVLHLAWAKKNVPAKPAVIGSFVLLALSLLLTFPPFIDAI
jgi:hypothetical protein